MATSPPLTDIVQVSVMGAQLIVLLVAAVVAGKQLGEAKRLREAQARPFVMIDFDIKDHLIFLVISNIGKTLARDVKFIVEPALVPTKEGYAAKDLTIFREGMPILPPGKVIRTVFDSFPEREARQDLPDRFEVIVRYRGESDSFEDRIDLDLDLYRNLVSVRRDEIHHVNQTLKKVLDEIKKWRPRGARGLVVMSPREKRRENERQARELEKARQESWFRQGPPEDSAPD